MLYIRVVEREIYIEAEEEVEEEEEKEDGEKESLVAALRRSKVQYLIHPSIFVVSTSSYAMDILIKICLRKPAKDYYMI